MKLLQDASQTLGFRGTSQFMLCNMFVCCRKVKIIHPFCIQYLWICVIGTCSLRQMHTHTLRTGWVFVLCLGHPQSCALESNLLLSVRRESSFFTVPSCLGCITWSRGSSRRQLWLCSLPRCALWMLLRAVLYWSCLDIWVLREDFVKLIVSLVIFPIHQVPCSLCVTFSHCTTWSF